ncbi:MAG: non-heme iron oxygenase ferredoxin subunit [Methylococcaceae bacterium]|nr:non-heme iron oxygenase ferredoxin subunit [Methylococcaceae bacterium]
MADWLDVIDENALADGEHVLVDVDGIDVAVFKLEGQFYALEDVCTHDGAEIASGRLEGDELVCPRHGARFCIKTGAVKSPPAYEDIVCFPVRVEHGRVQVRDGAGD